jgi:3-hydroxy-9,10-secoandrosta-1,3,5(10)-triene-9,17-dione monooxygenase reductase component
VTGRTLDPNRSDDLKTVMGHFCSGVVIVTALDAGEPIGFTCQAFASLSLDPPLVVVAPAQTSTTFPRIRAVGAFAVNVLAERQELIARAFAKSGGRKFTGVHWRRGAGGAPILDGALAWAECRIVGEHQAGDHSLVVAHVEGIGHAGDGRPLVFHRGRFAGIHLPWVESRPSRQPA